MKLIEIPVEGKTATEVLDAIYEARSPHDSMWWPDIRLLAGSLREPFEGAVGVDENGEQTMVSIVEIPAGSTFWGVLVV